jgi:hypothetical protein
VQVHSVVKVETKVHLRFFRDCLVSSTVAIMNHTLFLRHICKQFRRHFFPQLLENNVSLSQLGGGGNPTIADFRTTSIGFVYSMKLVF